MKITRVYTKSPWEEKVAYCRAKRMGNFIAVAGTTAVNEKGEIFAPGDTPAQARFVLEKISNALQQLGATLENTLRTRMYVTELDSFDELAAVHRQYFATIDPVASCIQVAGLVDPQLTIEIELDAIVF